MKKQSEINKNLLCAENNVNSLNYENLAMTILSKKTEGTNFSAITTDIKSSNISAIVTLNVAYILKKHNKNVLVINLDTQSQAINNLLVASNDNEKIVNYKEIDVLLPNTADLFCGMTLDDLKNKFSEYDFVIFCVPSPKYSTNYLALPKSVDFYILINRFFSSYFAANKCLDLLDTAEQNIVGSVYIKIK